MRCEHAFDDGAYVLGALGPAERDAYEKHLAGCADCREAVASLAVLPGLLGRLSAVDAASSAASTAEFVTEQRIPRLVEAVTASRRRERRRLAAAALVTACVMLIAGWTVGSVRLVNDSVAFVPTPSASPSPSPSPKMIPMAVLVPEGRVTAEVAFKEGPAGTTITMHCAYAEWEGHTQQWMFRLVALGPDGAPEQVMSWWAGPGEQRTFESTVRFRLGELTRLEVRSGKDGRVLLAYDVP